MALFLTRVAPGCAHLGVIPGLSSEERVVIFSPDLFNPPGLQLMDVHVEFPLAKLLRSTEQQFLHDAGEEYECTSADGPFCYARLEQQAAAEEAGASTKNEHSVLVPELTSIEAFDRILGLFPTLVYFYSPSRCGKCIQAHVEVRRAAAELATSHTNTVVVGVDCDQSDGGGAICSRELVAVDLLPDIRLYLDGPDSSIRWGPEVQASTTAGLSEKVKLEAVKSAGMTALGWDATSLVKFVTDTRMHSLFKTISQLSKREASPTTQMRFGVKEFTVDGEDAVVVLDKVMDLQDVDALEILQLLEKAMQGDGALEAAETSEAQSVAEKTAKDLDSLLSRVLGPGAMKQVIKQSSSEDDDDVEVVDGIVVRNLASMESATTRNIEFQNESANTMELMWIDFKGKEQSYSTLHPGSKRLLSSFLNHVWLVREKATREGVKVVIVVSGIGTQKIVIDQSDLPSNVPV